MLESKTRSVLKSISWRIIGTIDTIIISYLIVGNTSVALSIGGIEVISKMVLYFAHERVWNYLKIGKIKKSHKEVMWFMLKLIGMCVLALIIATITG